MPYTIPPGNKTAGQGGFMSDIDNAYKALSAVAGVDVQNAAYAGGAIGDGVSDDTAAIQAAINAAGAGITRLPAGTYKVTGTLTVSAQGAYLVGAGRRATTIAYTGTGPCISMHGPAAGGTSGTWHGGGVSRMTIDGTGAPSATAGIDFGDWYAAEFTDLEIVQFTAVGASGFRFFNAANTTEKTTLRAHIAFCDTCITFDVATVGTANRSFGYTDLWCEMDGMTGNGIQLTNGAQVYHSQLTCRANVRAGAGSSYACILVAGKMAAGMSNAGSASQIAASRLDFQAEANSATSVQSTILFDLSNNARIYNCTGILDFGFGSQMALSNTSQAAAGSNYFQFQGVVAGDSNLNPGGSASGFASAAPVLFGRGQFSSGGTVYAQLGDFFSVTLTGSITVALTGAGNCIPGPQRKTLVITQAAAGGPYTVTWPHPGSPSLSSPTVLWAGGTPPTMSAGASAVDKYELSTVDGIHWYGTAAQALA